MYTFVVVDLYRPASTINLSYIAEIQLDDPEHIAERIDYWDKMIRPRADEETCIALIVEE